MSKIEYNAYYDEAKGYIGEAINNSLTKVGIMAKNDAVKLAPVDNGFLRQSIDYQVEGDKVLIGSTDGTVTLREWNEIDGGAQFKGAGH